MRAGILVRVHARWVRVVMVWNRVAIARIKKHVIIDCRFRLLAEILHGLLADRHVRARGAIATAVANHAFRESSIERAVYVDPINCQCDAAPQLVCLGSLAAIVHEIGRRNRLVAAIGEMRHVQVVVVRFVVWQRVVRVGGTKVGNEKPIKFAR
jgi:hypothetical protein